MTGELIGRMLAWVFLLLAVWWGIRLVAAAKHHREQMKLHATIQRIIETPGFQFRTEGEAVTVWYLIAQEDYEGALAVLMEPPLGTVH